MQEGFEGEPAAWQVTVEQAGDGQVLRSNAHAQGGSYSAQASTNGTGSVAQVRAAVDEPTDAHSWGERPGTWLWQRAYVFAPSTTVAHLGQGEQFAIAGFWPNTGGAFGWWLEVTENGELQVRGYDADGYEQRFRIYGRLPLDRWVQIEIGLHSQNGPGVKRAFAVLVDGDFYGWYHQGHLAGETYDRAAMGILATNSPDPLAVFVDHWYVATTDQWPGGPDNRATSNLQEQDYRTLSGVQWQIDWSTWQDDLRLDATAGLYSANNRLQSGRNLDRMPDLTEGWAEIEIDWPVGTPPALPNPAFAPMIAFRKEINREENLEVVPVSVGNGDVNLVFDAWAGGPVVLAQWPLPEASIGGTHIPEPGDVIRARWRQASASAIRVQASYYDASQNQWYVDVIDHTFEATSVGNSGSEPVNFQDGYHTAASVTIDSPYYSIRRFRLGTSETYP